MYNAHVQSILMYASQRTETDKLKLETIQNNLLRYLAFITKPNFNTFNHDYSIPYQILITTFRKSKNTNRFLCINYQMIA